MFFILIVLFLRAAKVTDFWGLTTIELWLDRGRSDHKKTPQSRQCGVILNITILDYLGSLATSVL